MDSYQISCTPGCISRDTWKPGKRVSRDCTFFLLYCKIWAWCPCSVQWSVRVRMTRNSTRNVDTDSRAEEKRVSNPNLVPVHRKKEDAPSKPQSLIQVKTNKHRARKTSTTQEDNKSRMSRPSAPRRLHSNYLLSSTSVCLCDLLPLKINVLQCNTLYNLKRNYTCSP